jgi:hypothetical protein
MLGQCHSAQAEQARHQSSAKALTNHVHRWKHLCSACTFVPLRLLSVTSWQCHRATALISGSAAHLSEVTRGGLICAFTWQRATRTCGPLWPKGRLMARRSGQASSASLCRCSQQTQQTAASCLVSSLTFSNAQCLCVAPCCRNMRVSRKRAWWLLRTLLERSKLAGPLKLPVGQVTLVVPTRFHGGM